jgi:putative ABC transport system substrate-binding protein
MKRREFMTLLAGVVVAWPLAARAQQAEQKYTVGILSAGSENTALSAAFSEALRELGWVEGRNVVFEYRYAENRPERLPALAADLVRLARPGGNPEWHAKHLGSRVQRFEALR